MLRRLVFGLAFLLALLFLRAPSSLADAPPEQSTPAETADYPLGVADVLQITVYDEPTLTGLFPVNADGTVAFPLIGNVKALGKTAVELQNEITARLADGYLKNPRVVVSVQTFRPFYILGEVNKPGEYPYATGLTVYKAVAIAGGFTYRADERRLYIKHSGSAQETRTPLTSGLIVQPGDTIRVTERYF